MIRRRSPRPKTLSAPRQFVAIEAKLGGKFKPHWAGGLKTLGRECGVQVRRGYIVYTGADRLEVDGIDVVPVPQFLEDLHSGRILG